MMFKFLVFIVVVVIGEIVFKMDFVGIEVLKFLGIFECFGRNIG